MTDNLRERMKAAITRKWSGLEHNKIGQEIIDDATSVAVKMVDLEKERNALAAQVVALREEVEEATWRDFAPGAEGGMDTSKAERDALAAQVAALRKALTDDGGGYPLADLLRACAVVDKARESLLLFSANRIEAALSLPAPSSLEAHDARVKAAAFREAANTYRDHGDRSPVWQVVVRALEQAAEVAEARAREIAGTSKEWNGG